MRELTIDVFADVVCPWCWIGDARLRTVLAMRPDVAPRLVWRPFQLYADMPKGGLPWTPFAAARFGSEERAQALYERVRQAGAEEGLTIAPERFRWAANTEDAHRLILFARTEAKEQEVARALYRGYFSEGANLNDLDVLADLAAAAGLDRAAARAFLDGDALRDEVRASLAAARRIGVEGVPFFVFGGRYAVSGAQPPVLIAEAIDAALAAADASS